MTPRVGIVGYGAVGSAMKRDLFPNAVVYDEPKAIGSRDELVDCDFTFVCVPTPSLPDGCCDTAIVEEVIGWLPAETIVIRSTVKPGTTNWLARKYGKRVVFQPEYGPGETPDHPFRSLRDVRWIVLGGERSATRVVAQLYQGVFNADVTIAQTDATTAELVKYMENAYLASKVAFCNELYDVAESLDVDYNEARELWLLDPRIGRSHTWVHPDSRGFGGKCLPKDLRALTSLAEAAGIETPILKGTLAWAR